MMREHVNKPLHDGEKGRFLRNSSKSTRWFSLILVRFASVGIAEDAGSNPAPSTILLFTKFRILGNV